VKKGFTLMELIIVVVIIGILAMVGLPQFFRVAERGRSAEAIAALGALRSAELRFAAETNSTTNVATNLDMDVPGITPNTPALRFFTITFGNPVNPNTNPTAVVARAQRNNVSNSYGNYILHIQADGVFFCTGGANNICDLVTPK
jgi:prepilin-type N-terminal cleavage/methylation domain-containing protein